MAAILAKCLPRRHLAPPRSLGTPLTGGGTQDNIDRLWSELDRGWRIGPYEFIMQAPAKGTCYTLIKLTSDTPIPAVPPHS
jgi:hypothetical protein